MSFGWDPAKSKKNAQERGLPFEIAMAMFDRHTLELDDRRLDYGDRRIQSYGMVADRVLACIYTLRGTPDDPIRWIISLRMANKGERYACHAAFPQRT